MAFATKPTRVNRSQQIIMRDQFMNKRTFLKGMVALASVPTATLAAKFILAGDDEFTDIELVSDEGIVKLNLTNAEWKEKLTPMQFKVLRKAGTERPFTSPLNNEKRDGIYACAGCDLPLFTADTKFESGTGWPSFFQPVANHIGTSTDYKLIYPRTEYHCARCGGHQGHVFKDGPKPTGLRYCNNGVALTFQAA